MNPTVIKPGHGLKVAANRDFVDDDGLERKTGEKWMVTRAGAYLVGVHEEVIEEAAPHTITENIALHMRSVV